ncbi:fumarylacetoacetate hydrolase family protein [Leekyejoonella antrihumi]|uniref:fumarylacetoacetate hydrolase family protein n=1 Tax=Leekyejoonella antrihumi TaxID=1660198 RepID=UPI0016496B04|nr:fumarylacetoacetate hydrolase family protein [Leekyejoonella antrihumi]
MRFATIATRRGLRLHLHGSQGYTDIGDVTGNETLSTLTGLLASGQDALQALVGISTDEGHPVDAADFGPAVPNPARVLCIGVNYREHAVEGGRDVPTWPEVFVRGGPSVTGPFADLVKPALTDRYDYEGELGVVIGTGGRYIRAANALDAVFGFVVLNDASARDWQRASTQWTGGKNFDQSMPVGPEIVTPDEVDVTNLQLTTTLNGAVMQSANTSQMIVSVVQCVEFLSSFTTLRPGDVIATGTPGGVGFARTPPVWLTPGDVVEVEVEGVGTIRNTVVAEVAAPGDWAWKPVVRQSNSI